MIEKINAILEQYRSNRSLEIHDIEFIALYDSLQQIAQQATDGTRLNTALKTLLSWHELTSRANQSNLFFCPSSLVNQCIYSIATCIAEQENIPVHTILYANALIWPTGEKWLDVIGGTDALPLDHSQFLVSSSGEICLLENLIETAIDVFMTGQRSIDNLWLSNDPRTAGQPLSDEITQVLITRFPAFQTLYQKLKEYSLDTPLTQLRMLRAGLSKGSAHGGSGEELNAGKEANNALALFAVWWNDIANVRHGDTTLQKKLGQLRWKPNLDRGERPEDCTLEKLIAVIFRKLTATTKNIDFTCVHLRGNELEDIITQNKTFLDSFEKKIPSRDELDEHKNQTIPALKAYKNQIWQTTNHKSIFSSPSEQLPYFAYALGSLWQNFCMGKVNESSLTAFANLIDASTPEQAQKLLHYPSDMQTLDASKDTPLRQALRALETKLSNNALLSLESRIPLSQRDEALIKIVSSNLRLLSWIMNRYEAIVFTNPDCVQLLLDKGVEVSLGLAKFTIQDQHNLAIYIRGKLKKTNENETALVEALFRKLEIPLECIPSPLLEAIHQGNLTKCYQLIQADPACVTHIDPVTLDSGFALAMRLQHLSICGLLLENGAIAEHKNKKGHMAKELWAGIASENPYVHFTQQLIEFARNLDSIPNERIRSLQNLVQMHTHWLTIAIDSEGNTLLHHMFLGWHHSALQTLTQHPQWQTLVQVKQHKTGNTLLTYVAIARDATLAKYLPIQALNPTEALFFASKHGMKTFCQQLLESGADPTRVNEQQKTAEMLWPNGAGANPIAAFRAQLHQQVSESLQSTLDLKLQQLFFTHTHFLTWPLDAEGHCLVHYAFMNHNEPLIQALVMHPNWLSLSQVHNNNTTTNLLCIVAKDGLIRWYPYFQHISLQEKKKALQTAFLNQQIGFCEALLQDGVIPDFIDAEGKTPLASAAYHGNIILCALFLRYAPSTLLICDTSGDSPLALAASQGHLEVCQLLIQQNPTLLTQENYHGFSPLEKAAEGNHSAVVTSFLWQGANPFRTIAQKLSAVSLWSDSRQANPVSLLCTELMAYAQDSSTISPERRDQLLQLILTHKCILTWPLDETGDTFLHHTFAATHWRLIDLFVELPEWQDLVAVTNCYDQSTILHAIAKKGLIDLLIYMPIHRLGMDIALVHAVENGHLGFCRFLIYQGANSQFITADGNTLLSVAAKHGHFDICLYFIDKKVNINHQNHEKYTALAHASAHAHEAICVLLIERGADPSLKTKFGKESSQLWSGEVDADPFQKFRIELQDIAFNTGNISEARREKTVSLLMQHTHLLTWSIQSAQRTFLHIIFEMHRIELIEKVIKLKVWKQLSQTIFADGLSLLDHLVITEHTDLYPHFSQTTANIRSSALQRATQYENKEFCTLLLQGNADAKHVNASGTPTLFTGAVTGNIEICALLLTHRADPWKKDKQTDKTPETYWLEHFPYKPNPFNIYCRNQHLAHKKAEIKKILDQKSSMLSSIVGWYSQEDQECVASLADRIEKIRFTVLDGPSKTAIQLLNSVINTWESEHIDAIQRRKRTYVLQSQTLTELRLAEIRALILPVKAAATSVIPESTHRASSKMAL